MDNGALSKMKYQHSNSDNGNLLILDSLAGTTSSMFTILV